MSTSYSGLLELIVRIQLIFVGFCQAGLEKTFQNVNFTFLFERSPAEAADSFEGTLKRQLP